MTWQIERKTNDKYSEQRGSNSSEIEYIVYTSDGLPATLDEARQAFTALYNWTTLRDSNGNKPSEFLIEEESDATGNVFVARVKFSPLPNETTTLGQDNPWWVESVDTSGGSAHITYGKNERCILFDPDDPDPPPAFDGGIGWNGESFDGCDIKTPALSFNAKTRLKYALMRQDIAEQFAFCTGAINKYDFCGFAKHCVQCTGVKGNVIFLPKDGELAEGEYGTPVQAVEAWYEFTVEFAVQPWINVCVNAATPDRTIRKNGYDYLWVLWATRDDPESGNTIKKPKAIYVNQVYPDADFGWFGINFFNF